ncbi:PilW family protein [Haliovirga abyssi]|uniref:Prepilin-type N-terminal cleavage/methylation domain-containing protein n=1 Tax=Haliovirga abyssi TaxID=2996794 RepID=A0AAU9DJ88_9FUSO|nr:prepilin-type N-terminal cleavage/methylation domain-containing protein [Haliovirga abyssi]BDU51697.1 hypothetical protein HLVA_22660 [Haliovirga abyssi]
MKIEKGFTLIELLIAISISSLVIYSAIAFLSIINKSLNMKTEKLIGTEDKIVEILKYNLRNINSTMDFKGKYNEMEFDRILKNEEKHIKIFFNGYKLIIKENKKEFDLTEEEEYARVEFIYIGLNGEWKSEWDFLKEKKMPKVITIRFFKKSNKIITKNISIYLMRDL